MGVVMLLLSGCSSLELFDALRQTEPHDEQAATFDPGLANGTKSTTTPTESAAPRAKPAVPRIAETAARTPPPPVAPDDLVGLSEAAAETLFGPPHFVIRQQPATRWHYVSRTCTLDLFFFEDLETRARRILAYDVGAARPGTDHGGLNTCVTSIRAERHDSTG